MAEIIYVPAGERLTVQDLKGPCCVYEAKPAGKLEATKLPGIGAWHLLPPEWFDSFVASASATAEYVGYERVYVIGHRE